MQSIQNKPPVIVQNTVLNMQILSMKVQSTGVYREQFYRPLTMEVNNENLSQLGNAVDQANGRIEQINFNTFAAQTLRPSADTLGIAHVPNGWGTERFSFELTVMVTTTMGQTEEKIIGWSERKDTTLNGLVDPNMYFYVNNVMQRRITQTHNSSGSFNSYSLVGSSQVFFEPQFTSIMDNSENVPRLIRPYDVYSRMAVKELDPSQSWMREFGSGGLRGAGSILDTRGTVTGVAETSRRTNCLNGSYLNRTIQSYANANMSRNMGFDDYSGDYGYSDRTGILNDARRDSSISEIPLSESYFLKRLSNSRMGSPVTQPMFTLKELYQLDPQLESPMDQRIQINNQSIQTNVFSASAWNTPTSTAIMAYFVAHAIPAILAKCGASGVVVTMQNINHHDPSVHITGATEMTIQAVPVVEAAIQNEIMPTLTCNQAVWVRYTGIMFQNATIEISINGSPMEIFDVPQFADSRFSPIITNEIGADTMTQVMDATLQRVGVPIQTNFSRMVENPEAFQGTASLTTPVNWDSGQLGQSDSPKLPSIFGQNKFGSLL